MQSPPHAPAPVAAPVLAPDTGAPPANSHADEVNAAVAARLKKLSMASSYRKYDLAFAFDINLFLAAVTSPVANRDPENAGADAAGKQKGDKALDAITMELQVR